MTSVSRTQRSWGRATFGAVLVLALGFAPAAWAVPRETLSTGANYTCGVRSDGTVACWGDNSFAGQQATPLAGTFTQVSVGLYHTCGVRSDGTIACWGFSGFGQATPPPGTFTQVSAGGSHTCGVRNDGTVACWGMRYFAGGDTPPTGTFTQVSAASGKGIEAVGVHTCGVKSDGTVACWGGDFISQPPDGRFTQVSVGARHTCGVKSDGAVACWGTNLDGQATSPAGTFTQISAGGVHTCGVRSDGTVACWGDNGFGQATPPPGTFTQVSAGLFHTCGVRSDGTIACWGSNIYGQAASPSGAFDLGTLDPGTPGSTGNLESPQQGSFESGIGLIRGWVCDANTVEVQINDEPLRQVAYGTTRKDTVEVCGDDNNGFGYTFNWNALGTGKHRLRALADGVEFANVTFNVTTLGVDFLRGANGEYALANFPQAGNTVTVRWSEPHQNFVIAGFSQSLASIQSDLAVPMASSSAYLESPQQGSFESGIGLIRGWVCDANTVEVQINDEPLRQVAYGTTRKDTVEVCGDDNNGFGYTFNWNALGTGKHRLRALADGVEFANVTFNVTTLGVDFLRGANGEYALANFPQVGNTVTVRWSEPHQNFVIINYRAAWASTTFNENFSQATLNSDWHVVSYPGPFPRAQGENTPANHYSLTDKPGFLRYYLDPWTYRSGFLNNYQRLYAGSFGPWDFGLEIFRVFEGESWVLEAKVTTYMPAPAATAADLDINIYFGDGGPNTYAARVMRYKDSYWGSDRIDAAFLKGNEYLDGRVTDIPGHPIVATAHIRISRAGTLVQIEYSLDGLEWEKSSYDFGQEIRGLPQRITIAGAGDIPNGAYADWDYVRLTLGSVVSLSIRDEYRTPEETAFPVRGTRSNTVARPDRKAILPSSRGDLSNLPPWRGSWDTIDGAIPNHGSVLPRATGSANCDEATQNDNTPTTTTFVSQTHSILWRNHGSGGSTADSVAVASSDHAPQNSC